MSMGISYSTAKWLVGHQVTPTTMNFAYLLQRHQRAFSSTSQPSSMAFSPPPTCWIFITQIYLSGARCPTSLVASSFPSSCSNLLGSTACTNLIPRSQSRALSWIKLVDFFRESPLDLDKADQSIVDFVPYYSIGNLCIGSMFSIQSSLLNPC